MSKNKEIFDKASKKALIVSNFVNEIREQDEYIVHWKATIVVCINIPLAAGGNKNFKLATVRTIFSSPESQQNEDYFPNLPEEEQKKLCDLEIGRALAWIEGKFYGSLILGYAQYKDKRVEHFDMQRITEMKPADATKLLYVDEEGKIQDKVTKEDTEELFKG